MNKLIAILLLVSTFSASAPPHLGFQGKKNNSSGASLTDSLAAYWKMDTSSGGTTPDATGNGEALTLNGTASISSGDGLFNNYLSASTGNGASHVDDSILGIGSGKSFTISAWYQPGGLGANQFLVGKWDTGNSAAQDYAIMVNQNFAWVFTAVDLSGTVITVTNCLHVNVPPTHLTPPNHLWANVC